MKIVKCFFEEVNISKEEALNALSFLIGKIEKEVYGK